MLPYRTRLRLFFAFCLLGCAPAFALRLALGEMADALLLSSQRVVPRALEKTGYQFLHADLPPALAAVLAKS